MSLAAVPPKCLVSLPCTKRCSLAHTHWPPLSEGAHIVGCYSNKSTFLPRPGLMYYFPSTPTLSPAPSPLLPAPLFLFWFYRCADSLAESVSRCLSWFTGRFNHPTPSDPTPSSRLWCITTQCAALPFLSVLSPLRSPLLHNPGTHAGALGFNPMLLPKIDRQEIPRSRDRGNSYLSNSGSPSIRGSGSCLRLCRMVFACYTPTGGSWPTPAGAGQARILDNFPVSHLHNL